MDRAACFLAGVLLVNCAGVLLVNCASGREHRVVLSVRSKSPTSTWPDVLKCALHFKTQACVQMSTSTKRR